MLQARSEPNKSKGFEKKGGFGFVFKFYQDSINTIG